MNPNIEKRTHHYDYDMKDETITKETVNIKDVSVAGISLALERLDDGTYKAMENPPPFEFDEIPWEIQIGEPGSLRGRYRLECIQYPKSGNPMDDGRYLLWAEYM